MIWSKKTCPECEGKGEISGKTCPSCFGDREVWESRVDEAIYKRSTGRTWKPVKEK
jgi:DnaJ-class molecular chaperone